MFEPEIDRRCLSCGASVRQQAAFCPQCGQMLDKRDGEQAAPIQPEEVDQTEEVGPNDDSDQTEADFIEPQSSPELTSDEGNEDSQTAVNEPSAIQVTPIKPPLVSFREESDGTGTTTVAKSSNVAVHDDPKGYETQPLIANPSKSNATVADLAASNFRRRGDAAPRIRENQVLAKVDKIRKASSIMIDQAAYDPSLRFLLVAGALFVIFLVLMIFSKVLG
ncbi:MAG TPA: zinc ribbon domain-containing protein [Pyrinomonadaceae bacterium]|nr:zinc ribbon domain-containing protein [Pyrinomonadaceae bacterium]